MEALAARYLSHEWKFCPRRGKKNNPTPTPKAKTHRLWQSAASLSNVAERGGSGHWSSPVAAVPFPSGSSSRLGCSSSASGLSLPSALAGSVPTPGAGPGSAGPPRGAHTPVPRRPPASGPLHHSFHPLGHGRAGSWLFVFISLLCGRSCPQWVQRRGLRGRGESRTHGRQAHTPGASAVSPRPGWCVCDRTRPSRLVTPSAHPSARSAAGARSGASSPTPERIPPLAWPEPPSCVGGTPQGQPWGHVSQKATHHLHGSVITFEQKEAAGFDRVLSAA